MSKYRVKPSEVEAFTFEELVQHGRENATSSYNGVPWSFEFRGVPITHERDDCYLIPTLERIRGMMPNDMLVIDGSGQFHVLQKRLFEQAYEKIEESVCTTGQDEVQRQMFQALFAESKARVHTTQPGESVMGIALRECGDENEWRHILACNPKFSDMLPHDYFPVGTMLTLPQRVK